MEVLMQKYPFCNTKYSIKTRKQKNEDIKKKKYAEIEKGLTLGCAYDPWWRLFGARRRTTAAAAAAS